MNAFKLFLESRATARNVAVAFFFAAIFLVFSRVFLGPLFRDVTGFLPFDLQYPLRREGIAILLGALNRTLAQRAYVPFLVADTGFALTLMWAITLAWTWMFLKAPNAVFAFLGRGGIILVPFVVAFLDLGENVGFYRVIHSPVGHARGDAIEWATGLHAMKTALVYVRDYLTVGFVLTSLLIVWLRRRMGKSSR